MKPRNVSVLACLVALLAQGCGWYESPVGSMECPRLASSEPLGRCPSGCRPIIGRPFDTSRGCSGARLTPLFCARDEGTNLRDGPSCVERFGTREVFSTLSPVLLTNRDQVIGFMPCSGADQAAVADAGFRECPAP